MTHPKKKIDTRHIKQKVWFFMCRVWETHIFCLEFSHPTHYTWKDFFDVSWVNTHIFRLVLISHILRTRRARHPPAIMRRITRQKCVFAHGMYKFLTSDTPAGSALHQQQRSATQDKNVCVHAWRVHISYTLHTRRARHSSATARHNTRGRVGKKDGRRCV